MTIHVSGLHIEKHPEDEAMTIVYSEKLFIQIVQENPDAPCIYRRGVPDQLKTVFDQCDAEGLKKFHTILINKFDEQGDVELNTHPLNTARGIFIEDCKLPTSPLREDVEHISRIFGTSTKKEWQLAFLFGNRDDSNGNLHTHQQPTMAMTWNGEHGSKWKNNEGKALYAQQGDLIYIPSGFPHGSPEKLEAGQKRFLGVWQEDDWNHRDLK